MFRLQHNLGQHGSEFELLNVDIPAAALGVVLWNLVNGVSQGGDRGEDAFRHVDTKCR